MSGVLDQNSFLQCEEIRRYKDEPMDETQCVHIFSESTNVGIEEGLKKVAILFCLQVFQFTTRRNMWQTPGQ